MYYRYAIGMAGPEGEPDGPEFSLGDDELAYVFPSDGSTSCVAVSVNLRDYAADALPRIGGVRGAARQPIPSSLLGSRRRRGPVACSGADRDPAPYASRPVPAGRWSAMPRSTRTRGPASAWTTPASHATFLAEALDDFLAGRAGEAESMAAYHRRRDEHTLADFRETCELGRDLNAFRDGSGATRPRG